MEVKNMSFERLHMVPKGWGFEKWIVNNEKYCGKILLCAFLCDILTVIIAVIAVNLFY